MLARFLAAAMCLLPLPAFADGPWIYEFEFGYKITAARAMAADCDKVVPLEHAQLYADRVRMGGPAGTPEYPTAGLLWSCGGSNPLYRHFIGRRCAKPLPKLELYCGWGHESHAFDGTEIYSDTLGVRGRFSWGKK